jgi:hypothetical protein
MAVEIVLRSEAEQTDHLIPGQTFSSAAQVNGYAPNKNMLASFQTLRMLIKARSA